MLNRRSQWELGGRARQKLGNAAQVVGNMPRHKAMRLAADWPGSPTTKDYQRAQALLSQLQQEMANPKYRIPQGQLTEGEKVVYAEELREITAAIRSLQGLIGVR